MTFDRKRYTAAKPTASVRRARVMVSLAIGRCAVSACACRSGMCCLVLGAAAWN